MQFPTTSKNGYVKQYTRIYGQKSNKGKLEILSAMIKDSFSVLTIYYGGTEPENVESGGNIIINIYLR